MNRIDKKFKELKENRKKAFIAFITAGYPSLAVTEKLILEFDRIGVDIIELGVPFSDPMADGPVIQEASQHALKKNTHLVDILKLVKKVRKSVEVPIALMSYYNPIFCFGDEKFVAAAAASGVDGVIIPDLPPEEGRGLIRSADKYKLDVIAFVSPTTSRGRIKYVASMARGFIYYVSLTGTTGARRALAPGLLAKLKEIKRVTAKPVCAGFGVSTHEQVRQVQRAADGAIVGSAIVKNIKENIHHKDLVSKVGIFVRALKGRNV